MSRTERRFIAVTVVALLTLLYVGSWILSPRVQAQGGRGEPIRCTVTTSTATTIATVGGDCLAKVGLSLNITDIAFSASATGIGADAFPTLKYGTGTACATGTTVFWGQLSAAALVVPDHYVTPIKLPANVDVCWISSTAGSKFLVLTGYYTP